MRLIKESCVQTYDEAMNAEIRGADRIELCSRLDLDGLTPSKELVKRLVSDLTIPLKVMVRPRKGDFCYSNEEINQMHDDILDFKTLGVFGVVIGALEDDKTVDINVVNELVSTSSGLDVTFHKAIDQTHNIFVEMEKLVKCKGVSSVLTSGQSAFVLNNKIMLLKILKHFKGKLNIILAGGITEKNLDNINSR